MPWSGLCWAGLNWGNYLVGVVCDYLPQVLHSGVWWSQWMFLGGSVFVLWLEGTCSPHYYSVPTYLIQRSSVMNNGSYVSDDSSDSRYLAY